jgi:hypothetical protein
MRIQGPAVIAEAQTSTVVTHRFEAHVDQFDAIVLERREKAAGTP